MLWGQCQELGGHSHVLGAQCPVSGALGRNHDQVLRNRPRFSWTVGTPWGLTIPLQNQLLEFEVPVEKQQGWSFVE